MNDPVIKMLSVEVYGKLRSYRFLPSHREYNNEQCIIIDNLTNRGAAVENLRVTMGTASEAMLENNCIHIGNVVKTSNRKEKHEMEGQKVIMRLKDRVYCIEKIFIRTELIKTVPPRKILYHYDSQRTRVRGEPVQGTNSEDTADPRMFRKRVEQETRS